jgi:hypothetical protein
MVGRTPIRYRNTDLVLACADDLTPLAAVFKAIGVCPRYVGHYEDGQWYASFAMDETFQEAEQNIAVMLAVVELLSDQAMDIWRSCTQREFNIGYDYGSEPPSFCHYLSNDLLRRMAEAGVSLGITLYRPEDD